MDKIKFIPLGLFFAVVAKGLIVGFSVMDAPVLLILGGLAAFYETKLTSAKYKELLKRMGEVDQKFVEVKQVSDEIKNHVSAIKVSQGFKTINTNANR